MKTKPKIILIVLLLICLCFEAHLTFAQTTPTTPRRMDIYAVVANGDTTMKPGDTQFHASTHVAATMYILLADTSNITGFHVKFGTTDGGNDLLEKNFDNTAGSFTDGTSLVRNGTKIYIGLGSYTGINTFYAEAYLENASGNSSVIKYAKQ